MFARCQLGLGGSLVEKHVGISIETVERHNPRANPTHEKSAKKLGYEYGFRTIFFNFERIFFVGWLVLVSCITFVGFNVFCYNFSNPKEIACTFFQPERNRKYPVIYCHFVGQRRNRLSLGPVYSDETMYKHVSLYHGASVQHAAVQAMRVP